jgi:Domain of unknown function (DUF3362)
MYYSGKNPLRRVTRDSENVVVAKGLRQRRLHKAFLRYHDPNNWPVLREALRRMGRGNLIGSGPKHLIPAYQPRGTGLAAEGSRKAPSRSAHTARPARPAHPMRTQHTGLPRTPSRLPHAAKPGGKPRGPGKGKR